MQLEALRSKQIPGSLLNSGSQLLEAHKDFQVTKPSESLLTSVTLSHILCSHIPRCYLPHAGMEKECSKVRDNKNPALVCYSSPLQPSIPTSKSFSLL